VNRSEQINEVAAALAKAQGEIRPAIKDSNNPHFKSRYADLASVWDACRDALSKHGLSVSQVPEVRESGHVLTTLLLHASGQWLSGELAIQADRAGLQALGSAITYARRYSLAAMVGVAPDDDDDAERAVIRPPPMRRPELVREPGDDAPDDRATYEALAAELGRRIAEIATDDALEPLAAEIRKLPPEHRKSPGDAYNARRRALRAQVSA
jgi:hypothetical protein